MTTVAEPWLELLRLLKAHDHEIITLPATDKKYPMDFLPRAVPAVQFHNCIPSYGTEICQSYMTELPSRTRKDSIGPMDSSPKTMIISYPRPLSGLKLEI